jgi:hypothetical protein
MGRCASARVRASERKAQNLRENARCTVTTGCNVVEGIDVVLEGEAVEVRDEAKLRRLAGLWSSKYDWAWQVRDGAFLGEEGNVAQVYEVAPSVAFGFGKGATFSQTKWRFR